MTQRQDDGGKQPQQADGGDGRKGAPDGVSASPTAGDGTGIHGRPGGGESDGGAYPNPQTGREPRSDFMGHGGQSDIGHHGGGQAGEQSETETNSPAKGAGDLERQSDTAKLPGDR